MSSRQGLLTPSDVKSKHFDFVIVGAGSAGCTLAYRLSESPDVSILLIEAGDGNYKPTFPGTPLELKRTPSFHTLLHQNPQSDWCYKTGVEKVFQNGNTCGVQPYARGKGLGGSSSINFNIWVRGTANDFDYWEKLGAKGWSFKDCLPFFMKSENATEIEEGGGEVDYSVRGRDGPIRVSLGSPIKKIPGKSFKTDGWVEAQLETLKKNGFEIGDYNDMKKSSHIAGRSQYSISKGERVSTDLALLKVLENRKNLHIVTGCQVSKILFDGDRAVGIELMNHLSGEKVAEVFSKKEIILSGGVFGSPQLLMLSGVGPREHLNSLGIPVKFDVPGIGQNLSDHLYLTYKTIGGKILEKYGVYGPITDYINPDSIKEYMENRTGFISKVCADVNAFINLTSSREDGGPDIQFLSLPVGFSWNPNIFDAKKSKPFMADENEPAQSLHFGLAQPKSRGSVTLRSCNPLDPPIIEHNFYSVEEDLKVHIAAYRFFDKIFTSGLFSDTQPLPGKLNSDEEISEYCFNNVHHGWHGCGTCRMGSLEDPLTVVDPNLRVRGISGLRVCDVSVFPVVTTGNTNSPTIMVAEKGASIIKNDYPDFF